MSLTGWLKQVSGLGRDESGPVRIVEHDAIPRLVYAIGDAHGCYDAFSRLEDRIAADVGARGGSALVIQLGDFVDRGSMVAQLVERLLGDAPPGIERLCLSGNHELVMSEFVNHPDPRHDWLRQGGAETLRSYGIDAGAWGREGRNTRMIGYQLGSMIPYEHRQFIADRPYLVRFGKLVFVHAGIDRARPLARQSVRDMLWSRPDLESDARYLDAPGPAGNVRVVHGHTPVRAVTVAPLRINLDTGAYAGGPLSAARFVEGRFDGLLSNTD